jgi:hypothetical protein
MVPPSPTSISFSRIEGKTLTKSTMDEQIIKELQQIQKNNQTIEELKQKVGIKADDGRRHT